MSSVKQTVITLLKQADITVNGKKRGDIIVHNDAFYSRIFAGGSLALGETYMEGIWDCDHIDVFIEKVFRTAIDEKIPKNLATVKHYLQSVIMNRQSKKRAWQVGQQHYDIGNDLYEKMLDKELCYSCAYWKDVKDPHNIDAAQIAKLDLICKKLKLKRGDKVLDIGCGWGAMARYAAKKYGAIVTGITISKEQLAYAKEKSKGLSCTFILEDYRVFAKECKDKGITFDAIISVGMFEHVGYKNYATFLKAANQLLKDDGLFLLHTIGNTVSVKHCDPWFDKYIFPNGMLPSIAQIAKASENLFVVEDWHNFGPYYEKTLLAWFARFDNAWSQLQKNPKYDERFYRMWKYYLLSFAGSFRARHSQLWQIVLSKNPKAIYEPVR